MNKRFIRFASALLAVISLATLAVYLYNHSDDKTQVTEQDLVAARKRMEGAARPEEVPAPAPLSPSRPVRLAVGGLGLTNEDLNRRVGDLIVAELMGTRGLDLVERQSLDKVLREMGLNLSGLVRAKDAVRVGKLVRADWFLLGSNFNLNGTNSIVVRVVDARTGVLREAGVFGMDQEATRIATSLAAFVRQCRQNAAEARSRLYLAIGSFEDLSLNSRQAALPTQLRSYLTAAYQGMNVTLLERESVSTLLREVRLDLAGLTDEVATNAPAMQSAYWMADGYYQSYETSEFEVELMLNVQRMFGRSQRIALREKPGEPLFRRVKESIDGVMKRDQVALSPTRVTELRAQLATGRELLESVKRTPGFNPGMDWIPYTGTLRESEVARLQTNITIQLPISSAPITRLCLGSSNIWVGTDGEGLIELDKATRQCHRLTEKDGLLMDHISELHLAMGTLWIG